MDWDECNEIDENDDDDDDDDVVEREIRRGCGSGTK